MEQKNGFMGIPNSTLGVIGILVLVGGALALCALVVLAFGLDVGGVLN